MEQQLTALFTNELAKIYSELGEEELIKRIIQLNEDNPDIDNMSDEEIEETYRKYFMSSEEETEEYACIKEEVPTEMEIILPMIMQGLHKTLIEKNRKYGNAFLNAVETEGFEHAVGMLRHKMERTSTLYKEYKKTDRESEQNAIEDSIYDSVLDLAGYCLQTLVYLSR